MSASGIESMLANRTVEYTAMGVFVAGLAVEWLRRSAARATRRREAAELHGPPVAERRRPHPAVMVLPLWLLVNALDTKGYFLLGHDQKRYALSAACVLICLLAGRRGSAVTTGQGLLVSGFLLYVVCGALAARFYTHPQSSSLPMAAGAVFLLAPLLVARLDEPEVRWLLRAVTATSVLELFVHFLAACQFIDSGINRSVGPVALYSNGAFTHEKAAIGFMAFHLLRRRANRLLQLGAALMMLVIFANYPAGTYLYAFAAYLCVLLLLKVKRRPALVLVLGTTVVGIFMVSFVLGGGDSVERSYYDAVGKTNNTATRELLWSTAMKQIHLHPWFGTYFSGEASVRVNVGNLPPTVPPHNDYLNIAMLGGWLGLVLFGLVVYVLVSRLCQAFAAPAETSPERRLVAEAVLIGVTVFLLSMMFNPSLLKVSLSALFFCLLGVGACVGTDRKPKARATPVPVMYGTRSSA